MLTKARVTKSIEDMPDGFTLDELMDRLILIEKVEKGLAQSKNDEVISDEDLEKEMAKLFK